VFDTIAGQEQVKKTLNAMIESERIPHSLLFAGPNGVGKGETAFELGRMLLCSSGIGSGCSNCRSCLRASKLEHPDLHLLFPYQAQPSESGKYEPWLTGLQEHRKLLAGEPYAPVTYERSRQIAVGLVSEIHDRLQESAFEGGRKVCIVLNADRLNVKTANSLLKILEEPPDGVHFILTTERLSSMLPTITSRASIIRFRRLRLNEIEDYLQSIGVGDAGIRQSSAAASEGSLKTAKSFVFSNAAETHVRACDLFVTAATGKIGDIVSSALPYLWSRDNSEAEALIYGFIRVTRSIMGKKTGVPAEGMVWSEELERLSHQTDVRSLNRLSAGFEKGLDMLARNVNISLVMSTVQYEIHDAFGKRKHI